MIHSEDQLRRDGNVEAIIAGLESKNPVSRLQSLAGAVNHGFADDAITQQIESLVNDPSRVLGYKISQLAIAALDKFGIKQYTGDDPTILRLIKADKWFE